MITVVSHWRGWRHCAALLMMLCLCGTVQAAAESLPSVDVPRIEAESSVMKRIRSEAKAHQGKLSQEAIDAGLELALSELMTALPEVVQALADERNVDLVADAAAARRAGVSTVDWTEDVIKRLDKALAQLRFEAP